MPQKSLSVAKKPIKAEVSLPGSKSLSNRVLLIAALANGESVIENLPLSKDVLAAVGALKALEVKHSFNKWEGKITILGGGGKFPKTNARIFCNEAGTLTRFIIPLCAAQEQGEYYIYAASRMMARPIQSQLQVLEAMGMKAIYEDVTHKLPITIKAQSLNQQGVLTIDGGQSSQFLSGLLMAAPFIKEGLVIKSNTDHPQSYVDMTVQMMRDFGVRINVQNHIYSVPAKQCYQACHYVIEPDLSTASYFWALAAITNGKMKVKHVKLNAKQGDIRFLEVLKMMGCQICEEQDGITVYGTDKLKGVTINMRNFSDTFMTVAAIACFAEGETHITGLAHTRLQESDRLSAMAEGLTRLGVKVKTTQDSIHIYPKESHLQSAEVDGHSDHRIAMSLALLGLVQSEVIIKGAECVSKTCPDYFERMEKIIQ
ncbi:3-phosphoshikimate 1-carboxyvinyltransferase [Fastidiosibacter lacustris]|uniref:3-phosphoshikimate 1-carboxyvinyltransferase n=1 Tax=Fastidiosibacter lacustris TaxID=2056695 RepID=UPI000E34C027|nr:3-phosphoshikimate 1-carboxyvinyltransferase [Fastidiosibacter lacustris]